MKHSVSFFEQQFQKQVSKNEFVLNPFEQMALPHLHGRVLDLGCGLGNLSIEAARRGARVVGVDASPTAIAHIRQVASAERLPLEGVEADLDDYQIDAHYDAIAAIGLLMFFPESRAIGLLEDIQRHVMTMGRAVINVLIEGTTFMGMFQTGHYYLFGRDELDRRFAGWKILESSHQTFGAPENSEKVFATLVAQKV